MTDCRPTLQDIMGHLGAICNDRRELLGVALGVPLSKIQNIESSHPGNVSRWILEMMQYWLDTTPDACWKQVVIALERVDQLTLASTIKQQYLWDQQPSTDKRAPSADVEPTSVIESEIKADVEIVEQLRDLGSKFSIMLTDCRQHLADCDIGCAKFFLNTLLKTSDFDECGGIEAVLNQLSHKYIDIFNVYPLEKLAACLKRDDVNTLVEQYKEKKNLFLQGTPVIIFQKALIDRTKPALSKEKVEVTIMVGRRFANDRVLMDMEILAGEVFEDNLKQFVHFHVKSGSIIVMWHVPKRLSDTLEQLIYKKAAMLREKGVEEVTIGGKIVYHSTEKEATKEASQDSLEQSEEKERRVLEKVYHEFHHQLVDVLSDSVTHHLIVSKLHTRAVISQEDMVSQMRMSSADSDRGSSLLTVLCLDKKPHRLRELITVMMEKDKMQLVAEEMTALLSKSEQADTIKGVLKHETSVMQKQTAFIEQLKTKVKNLEDLVMVMKDRISSLQCKGYKETELKMPFLVKEGREVAIVGQKTSIELETTSSLLLDQISCQLTDPSSQPVECSITSTKSGGITVNYTPTQSGAHQLKIVVGDTDIPGSPFELAVHVLPSLEMRGLPIKTITGVDSPWGVAVSKNGEVVVSEYDGDHIAVFNTEGIQIRKFGSRGSCRGKLNGPRGIAITADNNILVADGLNHRIQMFTIEGEFVKSVGEKGDGLLQFNFPAGVAVHHSGLVFVADSHNNRIQVLKPDLSLSHMFGGGLGRLKSPMGVACDDSSVHVVHGNHHVQSFSTGGQYISSFGSKGTQLGQLYCPNGICMDTNTVYVTDHNNRVSIFNNKGKFLKCLGNEKGELGCPRGIAINNTTRNIYVCDRMNNRIVVY